MSVIRFRPRDADLSLYHLLDPAVVADPYPLYHRLRREAPVHWDPYLHAWVLTRYQDVVHVLHRFSANCVMRPEQLAALGLEKLAPVGAVLARQMLFLDPPAHARVRDVASAAFTPRRVARLRAHIQRITDDLLDRALEGGEFDAIADLANPLPAIVNAEFLGVPAEDHAQLKRWSQTFGEVLGNFQYDPDRAVSILAGLDDMTAYFRAALREGAASGGGKGLVDVLGSPRPGGERLTEEEQVANLILTMVGGQETTTNLIGNGLLALLSHPKELSRLRADPTLVPTAVEELLRFESPSQQTRRRATDDTLLGGKAVQARQTVIAVLGAANRDPERFPEPDRLDLGRKDNRHLAFGWGGHFCFGAPLARLEGEIVFSTILRRLPRLELAGDVRWRPNLGLRGLTGLRLRRGPALTGGVT